MQETAELKTFLDAKKKQNMKYASLFMLMIILAVLTGLFVFGVIKVYNVYNDSAEQWEAPARYCAEQTASIVGTVDSLFNNEVVRACLLVNNKSEVINKVREEIQTLPTNK